MPTEPWHRRRREMGAGMRKADPHAVGAFVSLALLFYVVVIRLHFVVLPLLFMALGFASYAWNGRRGLRLFLFLLPLINSLPGLFFNGYPFNTMGLPLFYLAGILGASRLKSETLPDEFPGQGAYLLFLALTAISALFVFLRWSNLGLPALAFLRDTPVAPSGERVSFACLFPVITLALFALSPELARLARQRHLSESEIFNPLKAGFCLSFLLALVQKWIAPGFMAQSWWTVKLKQGNGGFSDFNAFGFFAGAMMLYQALKLIGRLPQRGGKAGAEAAGSAWADGMFLGVALAAIFVSGSRAAFLFVLAAAIALASSRKVGLAAKAAVVLLLAGSLIIAGGTLARRLQRTVASAARLSASADLTQAVDKISNGRLKMLADSMRLIGRFPVSGVGAGNFLFSLKYLRYGEDAYLDLPLNQYLLFFTETGLAGGLAFIFFLGALWRRQKPGGPRFMLAAMACALLFNNFFWFPEVLLLFWIVVSQGEWGQVARWKGGTAWATAVVLFFVAMNMIGFQALHPRAWAREKGTPYDYGFSYPERDAKRGREFRWSAAKAGIYVYSDKGGSVYRLFCGAPLPSLPGQRQAVDVYWRGSLYRTFVFRSNREFRLRLEGAGEGFLEFRVLPAFNLKRMGLGDESRDLGVQVSGGGK